MTIEKVILHQFRNYDYLQHHFSSGLNLFVGRNGAGKTNLLESIYYLSHFTSFRTRQMEILSKDRKRIFSIQLFFSQPRKTDLSVAHENAQTSIKLNGKKVESHAQVQGLLKVMLFSVRDIDLILLAPSLRRTFFDQTLSLMKKEYQELLKNYNKLIKLRNQQLKRGRLDPQWDRLIAPYGTQIIYARHSFLKAIIPLFQKIFSRFSHPSIPVSISYRQNKPTTNLQIDQVGYQKILDQQRKEDEKKGFTHFGPHTDDFLFRIRDELCKNHASQGEMRIFIYALKLSIYEYFKKVIKKNPILLLDDVFNDFDEVRIEKFFHYLKQQNQVIISCANPNLITPYVDQKVLQRSLFRIEEGAIHKP